MKLTNHLHPLPRRAREAIPPLPQFFFLAWYLIKQYIYITSTFLTLLSFVQTQKEMTNVFRIFKEKFGNAAMETWQTV